MSTGATNEQRGRCLVIGGLGFLGSRIAAALAREGYAVRVFDRACSDAAKQTVAAWGAELLLGDLAAPADARRAVAGADYVFHCAYATVPRTAAADPAHDLRSNVLVLLQLLEAIQNEAVCRRIVYMSSGGTVYGPHDARLLSEDHPTNPISAYGVSKLASEKYIQLYRARHGIDATILRLSNPYGPGQNIGTPQGVVGHFLNRIANGETLELWGDGSVVRDYFFADDLDDLAPRLLSTAASGIFNIGSGEGRSLNNVISTIGDVVGAPIAVNHLPAQQYDAPRNVLDVSKARDLLGWAASTGFAAGVAKTWERIARAREERE